MKKIIFILGLLTLLLPRLSYSAAIAVDDFITADDVTIAHLQDFKNIVVDAINSADGALLQDESVTAAKLDANANPENRWNELFNDFVFDGLLPPTSTTLITTTTGGTAYINGVRVAKAATAHTYTASRYTFVDLSDTGTYTYSAITFGGSEPATALNSIRLARVSSDGTQIPAVRDDRVLTLSSLLSATSLIDGDSDTMIQVEESDDEDIIRFDIAGTEIGTYTASSGMISRMAVGSFTRDIAVTGAQSVTGVGFKPKALIFFASVDGTKSASWGFSDLALTDNAIAVPDLASATTGLTRAQADRIAVLITGGTVYARADVTSYNADGFTITWSKTGVPTGTVTIYYFAIG